MAKLLLEVADCKDASQPAKVQDTARKTVRVTTSPLDALERRDAGILSFSLPSVQVPAILVMILVRFRPSTPLQGNFLFRRTRNYFS